MCGEAKIILYSPAFNTAHLGRWWGYFCKTAKGLPVQTNAQLHRTSIPPCLQYHLEGCDVITFRHYCKRSNVVVLSEIAGDRQLQPKLMRRRSVRQAERNELTLVPAVDLVSVEEEGQTWHCHCPRNKNTFRGQLQKGKVVPGQVPRTPPLSFCQVRGPRSVLPQAL